MEMRCLASVLALAVLVAAAGAAMSAQEPEPALPLSPADRQWLEEIALLLLPEEREAFLALSEPYQRQAFRERFWRIRDPHPQSGINELREAWRERLEMADEELSGPDDPRRDPLLLTGPPGRRVEVHCSALPVLDLWFYAGSERSPGPTALIFRRGGPGGWTWEERPSLSMLATGTEGFGRSDGDLRQLVAATCPDGDAVLAAFDIALDREEFIERFRPRVDTGWVEEFRGRLTELPEGAATFDAEVTVRFPGRHGLRTVVQALIAVPRTALEAAENADQGPYYDLLVDGEVVREGELFEHFRYRYSLPAGAAEEGTVPVLFERYLRPGSWRLAIKLEDRSGGAFFRTELPVEVPALPAPGPVETGLGESVAPPASPETAAAVPVEPSVQLLPVPRELVTGPLRIHAEVDGEEIAAVEFWLDGKPVLRKTRPPYSVELDVGPAPRSHTVRAVALDAGRSPVASDETVINGGPNRLEVQLLEPRVGGSYSDAVRARARVEVPDGEVLDAVEFYLNGRLMGTLYQPPFALPLQLPHGEEVTWVRARACLVGGRCNEDLVFVQAPEHLEQLDVHMVELFLTVLDRRGHAVPDLAGEVFRVLEDGVEQEVRRFELARDLASYSVVLLDLSTSMLEELADAERTALGFFEHVLSAKDRCAVMTFADEPNLAVPLTNDLEVLRGGLAGIVAEGETALWDGVVHAVHYLGGLEGRRALIVISDGEDSISRFGFDEALEYATRSQVTIYPIVLSTGSRSVQARTGLQQLARATGGRTFEIDRAAGLDKIYAMIEEELHSQYLLAYQSTQTEGTEFREVEIEVQRPGLKVRTAPGYYP
ncbi:MAG: VWA domain-containing protein [Thermoanaerobaculia bacterium]